MCNHWSFFARYALDCPYRFVPTANLHIRHGLAGRVHWVYLLLWCGWGLPGGGSYLAAALHCWHMWNYGQPKSQIFFSFCGFWPTSFPLVSFLYNCCFKHKCQTLKLLLLTINAALLSSVYWEFAMFMLLGFPQGLPLGIFWILCLPFSCFFPKKLLSVYGEKRLHM